MSAHTLSAPNLPIAQGQVMATEDFVNAGHTRASLAALESSGRIIRLRAGYYWALAPDGGNPDPAERHRAEAVAALWHASAHGRTLVLAGDAAALWWDLPWVGPAPTHVAIVGPRIRHGGSRSLVRPIGAVPEADIVRHNGAFVTSPARTVVDAARLSADRCGLVIADAALCVGAASRDDLERQLPALRGLKGVARARWCVAEARAGAESPGESISRYVMLKARLPMPELQSSFDLPDGSVARVDFFWPERTLVGEFDGATKYRSGGRDRTAADIVIAEKLREDGLRALGLRVVRWSWADAWQPTELITRLRALLT